MSGRVSLLCGAVSGPLFLLILFIEGATRPGYNWIRHAGSSLELGGGAGWMQQANFVLTGVLTIVFAAGLPGVLRERGRRSVWGPLLIGVWGLGLIGAGVFLDDPVSGYPPGTPAITIPPTMHGALHGKTSLIGFLAMLAAFVVFARRFAGWGERRWALYSALSAVLFPAGLVLFVAAFEQVAGLVDIGGLIQRLTVTIVFAWLTLLAIHLARTPVDARDLTHAR
ncbi:DUF998 domain-containing protein [Streptosporangiaceae bacterium NEAU-GS5]|nr:DUF998 domain-containing protein [Streptosporangiaceae bacterium NEAU-GS5]